MPRFAANLSMLFTETGFIDRFARAVAAGFDGVEYLFPYEWEPADLRRQLQDNGLRQVLFNMPPGDWAGGERGLAALPGREREFSDSVEQAIAYARELDCPRLHVMAGCLPSGVPADAARLVYLDNLQHAARRCAAHGITLLIEPINNIDMPGYFLNTSSQAIEIMDSVGADNLRLQYDCYHMQIMEGNLSDTLQRLLPRIGHLQIAGVPGRHEPDVGEINYGYLFERLDEWGYEGWIGCEYRPDGDTDAGLGWFAPYRR